MADSGDAKPTPAAEQVASSEPRLAEQETKMATNPSGIEADTTSTSDEKPATYTDMASSAAATAATTATAAASGVKDSVFSMFGGGAKKDKKVEEDDEGKDEPSGSSKAKKDEDDEVYELQCSLYTQVLD